VLDKDASQQHFFSRCLLNSLFYQSVSTPGKLSIDLSELCFSALDSVAAD